MVDYTFFVKMNFKFPITFDFNYMDHVSYWNFYPLSFFTFAVMNKNQVMLKNNLTLICKLDIA